MNEGVAPLRGESFIVTSDQSAEQDTRIPGSGAVQNFANARPERGQCALRAGSRSHNPHGRGEKRSRTAASREERPLVDPGVSVPAASGL